MQIHISVRHVSVVAFFCVFNLTHGRALTAQTADPLPSWNEGQAKQCILAFVAKVTKAGSPDFVPPAERIAVFDNDGTLWPEQPMYTQLRFSLDRVKALAPQHPEWTNNEPFKSALAGDLEGVAASGMKGVLELITATHAGNTTEEFEQIVKDWLASAQHPTLNKLYTELTYQPMRELLTHLRANGFKTYIVSGGGVEFMRPWTNGVYGIPPEQVIGSTIRQNSSSAMAGLSWCVCRRLTLSTTKLESLWAFTNSSVAARFSPRAIPTGISKCSSGQPLPPGRDSASLSTTPTLSVSFTAIAIRTLADSIRRSIRPRSTAGRSLT